MIACSGGHTDIVELFLDRSYRNIELDTLANDGRTAKQLACHNGHRDVHDLLFEHQVRNILLNSGDKDEESDEESCACENCL